VSDDNKILFHSVLSYPAETNAKNPKCSSFIKRQGKILHHKCAIDWIGCSMGSKVKKYVCEEHEFEWLTKTIQLQWKGKKFRQTYKMLVPEPSGKRSSACDASTASKGLGRDHALARLLSNDITNHIIEHKESVTVEECDEMISQLQSQNPHTIEDKLCISEEINIAMAAQVETLKSHWAQTTTVVQQMVEESCIEEHIPLNSSLEQSLGLRAEKGTANVMKVPGKNSFHFHVVKPDGWNKKHCVADDPPLLDLNISAKEVRRQTGFCSLDGLLSYIFVVGNGDIARIMQQVSSLTWLEEWFLYLEYQNGKLMTRIEDVMAVTKLIKNAPLEFLHTSAKWSIAQ
jgi:hypothetical protein